VVIDKVLIWENRAEIGRSLERRMSAGKAVKHFHVGTIGYNAGDSATDVVDVAKDFVRIQGSALLVSND
jgi:hypothetical protein